MAQDTLIPLTALPRRLLFRERQLEEAVRLIERRESFVVRGPFGTGKTTLVRMALSRTMAPHVFVECTNCRTYTCIKRKLDPGMLVVLDDYSLVRRTPELAFLVSSLPFKIATVNTSFTGEELGKLRAIEMPPYTKQEIFEILVERAVEANLRVEDREIEKCAEKGHRACGNVRVALLCLAGYL
jgi:Cdc6-like AAA superfamily ATPase